MNPFLWQTALMPLHPPTALFLKTHSVAPLGASPAPDVYTKAGLIPYLRLGEEFLYYVMKPAAKRPDLPPPEFQLCKGTRMSNASGQWADIKEGAVIDAGAEPLAQTALREGMEEIGLVLENIVQLYEIGAFDFASASTGKNKTAWFFAAQVAEQGRFTQPDATTAECKWMTLLEFAIAGRADHHYILSQIDAILKESRHSSR